MPYKPNERLYRSFSASNFKPVTEPLPEVRDGEGEEQVSEPTYKVRGYYTVWDAEYLLYDPVPSLDWPAEYEKVDRNALESADLSDVLFQENHTGSPLARIRNGSLTLGTDEHGAWCEAYLGGCQRGRELFESIANGLVVEMSFGFTIADDENGVGMTTFKDENGDFHTTITRVAKVFDVSPVSIPASHYTEVSELRSRSAAGSEIEADREARIQERERMAAQEAARAAEEAEREQLEEQERIAAQTASQRRKRMAAALRLASM